MNDAAAVFALISENVIVQVTDNQAAAPKLCTYRWVSESGTVHLCTGASQIATKKHQALADEGAFRAKATCDICQCCRIHCPEHFRIR